MKKPEDFLEELKNSKGFKDANIDIETFFEKYASCDVKTNAVKCVIGNRTLYEVVDRGKLAKECENAYGWKASTTEIGHYVSVLKWFPEPDGKLVPSLCH